MCARLVSVLCSCASWRCHLSRLFSRFMGPELCLHWLHFHHFSPFFLSIFFTLASCAATNSEKERKKERNCRSLSSLLAESVRFFHPHPDRAQMNRTHFTFWFRQIKGNCCEKRYVAVVVVAEWWRRWRRRRRPRWHQRHQQRPHSWFSAV